MKTFIITLLVGFGLSLSSYAKEAVAFVTHKIVINSEGKVERVVPMRSELVIPENSATTIKDHYNNLQNSETLFDFKGALNKAVDKTVSVVSGDTFKKVAGGVAGAVAAIGVGVGAYSALKGDENKKDWAKMNAYIDKKEDVEVSDKMNRIFGYSEDKNRKNRALEKAVDERLKERWGVDTKVENKNLENFDMNK